LKYCVIVVLQVYSNQKMKFAMIRRLAAIGSLSGTSLALFMWGFPKYQEYKKIKVFVFCLQFFSLFVYWDRIICVHDLLSNKN